MIGLNNQVWVTSALSDHDVQKALVLCCSLRRGFTSRKVAVIASPKISLGLRNALHDGFDLVFFLDQDQNMACLKLEDFAKLYAMVALSSYEKCAYLSPNMIALKNCDDIFEGDLSRGFLLPENDKDMSVFLFRPSMKSFKSLMTSLSSSAKINGTGIGPYLKTWMANQNASEAVFLNGKYNLELSPGKMSFGFENEMSIVNFSMSYPEEKSEKEGCLETQFGILGKLIAVHWLKIFQNDVKPLMEQSANFTIPINPTFSMPVNCTKEPVAIVGMSCRFPGSNNIEEFWELLFQGQDGTCAPPPFRWRRDQCSRPRTDCNKSNAGFLKVPVDEFDAKFFGISPKEVVFMDPQQRLIHELIWEGLEDACVDIHTLFGTPGSVFLGAWTNDYKDILVASRSDEISFFRGYMGNSIGAAAARISHHLGLTGPCVATESGCSSAMVAVHLACKSLQSGETNLALACGVNMLLHPFGPKIMDHIVAPDGHCKTFSEDADGFARAEGCGVLVLKRLSDAVKDKDKIWGLIRGSAISQEGISKSIGTPTVHCESLSMMEALNNAQVSPEQVSYVEAHGTGTVVGDPMEVAAIAKAYHAASRKKPLVIGSVKTNVGHTESCSGITGIMKVILSMHNEVIPAHRNFTKLNPSIDLDAVPAVIPLESMPWKRCPDRPRIGGVSSFGITGTDAHAIIEEAPIITTSNALIMEHEIFEERPFQILKISAKTEEALENLLERYQEHILQSTDEDSIADLAYSANIGRANFPNRALVIGKTKEEIVAGIQQKKYLKGIAPDDNDQGKICFLFTGQGSQYPGMAHSLYKSSPVFRIHFDYCGKLLKELYEIDIKDVLWSSEADQLRRTIYSQTAIFCVEYALLKLWESWGLQPDYVLGHSLGEFAAAVCAGILSIESAIKLVAERSRLIDELPRGSMLVIKASQPEVVKLMKTSGIQLDFAAVNSNEQTVVAGDTGMIQDFAEFCKQECDLKCIILDASHAFHSRHMDPILEKYRHAAKLTLGKKFDGHQGNYKCGYISGMRGDLIDEQSLVNAEYWVQHTREKVQFLKASKKAVELGCRTFIEVGPQPVLSALTLMNNDHLSLTCLPSLKRNENEWQTMLSTLAKLYLKGAPIDWQGIDMFQNRKKCRLPHYPFIGKKFWPDLMQLGGNNMIHPLVGSPIPNASSTKLFHSAVNLKSDQKYIKDHCIGQNIILPGSCYLEMCLVAGFAAIDGGDISKKLSRPLKVENLSIQAPLELEDGKTTELQTVVEFNSSSTSSSDWNDFMIKIFHRVEMETTGSPTWLQHAKATFSPVVTAEEQRALGFDLDKFRDTLTSNETNEDTISQVYEKLSTIGLNFGPTFQSIEKLWRVKEKETNCILAKVKVPGVMEDETDGGSQQQNGYLVHPVILDAMLQAIMMLKLTSNLKKKLYIPIQIGKLIWLSTESEEASKDEVYVQAFEDTESTDLGPGNTENCKAYLVDSTGKVMAIMSRVEFIETTAKAIESVLKQQTSTMPDLWEEVWRPNLGPVQHPVDLNILLESLPTSGNFTEELLEKYNDCPDVHETFTQLGSLVYYNMLRAMYEIGWKTPAINTVFNENDLFCELSIEKQFRKQFSYFLRVFEEEGIIKRKSEKSLEWTVMQIPPTLHEIKKELESSLFSQDLVEKFKPTLLFSKIGENLAKILKGNQSALSILFPSEDSSNNAKYEPSVHEFYTEYVKLLKVDKMVVEIFGKWQKACKSQVGGKFVFRILEVGAGTGGYTQGLLETCEKNDVEFEYTYTDISSAFFPAAERKFEKYLKHMQFKKLNIEEDPLSQGFVPGYYDLISASDVIHATRDLKESLRNVRTLLKPGGFFELFEMIRVNRFITFMFGLLDGFWRFEDYEIRPDHCIVSRNTWVKVLEECGLSVVGVYPCANNHNANIKCIKTAGMAGNEKSDHDPLKTWVVFHQENSSISTFLTEKLSNLGGSNRNIVVVERGNGKYKVRPDSEQDFEDLFMDILNEDKIIEGIVYSWALDKSLKSQAGILQPYFYLIKAIAALKQATPPRISVLTSGTVPLEENDLTHVQASTLLGFTRCLKNEISELPCKCIDVGDDENKIEEDEKVQIFYELWNAGKEMQVAYQGRSRYVPKFQPYKPTLADLELPSGTDRFQLIIPDSKSISDLQFGPLEIFSLAPNEIEIQVKSSALNFRDVFSVLKPTEQFKDVNAIGFDFAGVVKRLGDQVSKWKVGDYVFGVNVNGAALPSHISLDQEDVLPVPEDMTLSDACTLPAVVATSFHCLVDVAHVQPTDTVLIHTASGGVGLSAVEICKSIGAKIIATAGSKRKQNYLRSLGIEHVFHSRNTKYGDQILEVTNGRGVDVVLNSLTSEGFKEATLKTCAVGARFVEMSKLSIWTTDEVKALRSDVVYTVVDVSSMKPESWRHLLKKLNELAEKKTINAIPYVRFNGVNIREALQYMQKAKHIGKVVCVMPEMRRQENGQWSVYTPMFNERSTYLITGGLGGIGFEVCKYMVKMGAKHVILAGRKAPGEVLQNAIAEINSQYESDIRTVQLDVGNYDHCRELIYTKIPQLGLPQLRGIMHAAGTLHDGLISSQNWNNLSSTFNTKINGTLNLHELTKNLRMEHFVLFSSVAAMLGSPGQCNHSAGNYFEDTMAHYRNSVGLPAITVNWGQWSEVGIATEIDLPGLKPLSNLQGVTALDYALKCQRTQISVLNVESLVLVSKLLPQAITFIDERAWKSGMGGVRAGVGVSVKLNSEEFWQQYDALQELPEKLKLVQERLSNILRDILKLDDSDPLDENSNFQDMGVDSLMFVEIKNEVQAMLGERLTVNANAVRDCNTIGLLTRKLVNLIEGNNDDGVDDAKVPTPEEVNLLIKEDCLLPDHIRPKCSSEQKRVAVNEISCVLLTGSTGTLGPYMLKELCSREQITEIVCLMRASRKNNGSLQDRLNDVLSEREMLEKVDSNKIRCITGNVALPKMGLESSAWNQLCDKVDAVFHCAASVQHVEIYKKRKVPKDNEMRTVNIQGLKNVLEFCCTGAKLKHVYSASSFVAAANVDPETGNFSEDWPHPDGYNGVTKMAYPITKFVGDVIMREAVVERGIDGKVFRFPIIVGDSTSGRFVLDQNHIMLRYLFILKTGLMPSNPIPMAMLPVDVCAKVSAHIFFQTEAPNDIYNLTNELPDTDQEFYRIAERLGYKVNFVEFSEFTERIRGSTLEDTPFAIFKEFYKEDDEILGLYDTTPALKQWVIDGVQKRDFFRSRKVEKLVPEFYKLYGRHSTMEYIYNDLLFAKSQGWLQKYGL